MKTSLIGKLFKGVVEAVKFVTTNGTSSDFVKGDGTLDSTEYSPSTHTHTLQEVTDEGATTTKAVNLGSGSQIGSDDYGHLKLGGDNCGIEYDADSLRIAVSTQGGNYTDLIIDSPSDSNNHVIYAPKNKSGTLALIEDLQNINDIEIGGRNYTLNTSNDWIDVSLTTGHTNIELIAPTVPNSGKYTASIIVKDTGGARYQIRLRQYTSTDSSFLASSSWTDEGERAVVTYDFSVNEEVDYTILFLAIRLESGSSDSKYKELMLEKGTIATDWTPAPEDQITDWDETDENSFSFLKNKPSSFPPSAHTHTFASLTSKPTTIGGYGITDFNSLGDARWALRTRTITGTGSLTGGGNLTANRTLDLTTTAKSDIVKGVTAHGWGNHAGLYFGALGSNVQDLDSLSRGSAYKVASATASSAGYSAYGSGFTMGYSNNLKTQLHFAHNGSIQSRHMVSGVWQDVETVAFQSWVNAQDFLKTETDPTVPSHVKAITTGDISNWNGKEDAFTKNTAFNKNFGTSAGTVAQGNDTRINNGQTAFGWGNHAGLYVPTSRTITAGNGLSGGGTLAANRTFNVNFGTSAGTVAEGNDDRLSDEREWKASTVGKDEAEAGAATTRRAWTAQRVRQAIVAWFNGISGTIGRTILKSDTAAEVRSGIGLGNSATRDVGDVAGTVMEGDDKRIANGGVLRTIVSVDLNFDIDTLNSPEQVGLYEGEFKLLGLESYIGVGAVNGVLEVVETSNTIMHICKTLKGDVFTRFYDINAWTPWTPLATQEWIINNFPTFSDLYGVNTVMEGGYYLIPGEAYKYFVWASKYVINGLLYTERIEGEVTLNPAHPTLNRFDLIVVTTDTQEPFRVIEGVPAENPVRPNFDTESEVDLTFIYVNSISDGGGQEGNYLLVYDENEGWPNEANASVTSPGGMPSADLEFTTWTYRGNKSIKFLETHPYNGDRKIIFTFNELKELSDYDKIIYHIMNTTSEGGMKTNGWLVFKNSQTNSIVQEVRMMDTLSHFQWEQHMISLEGGSGEFDIIELQTSSRRGSSNFYEGTLIDYIFLSSDTGTGTGGGQQLIQRTSQIPINDGEDGSSPYATQKWVEEYSGGMALLAGDVILDNRGANINNRVFIHNGDGGAGIGIWLTGNEGAEFTILNNSNQELTVMSGSNLFVKLVGMGIGTTSPGGFRVIDTFPREYKGRFKVVNGEFLEIG